jgi:hypothetical protein
VLGSARRRDDHFAAVALDRSNCVIEEDVAVDIGRDRLVERRGPLRQPPAEHGRFEVGPATVAGGGDPAQELEHPGVRGPHRRARGDPEQQQLLDAARQLQCGDPLVCRHVEVLEPLRVGR